jgi:hypothetical protein
MTLEPAPSARDAPRYGQRICSRTRVGIERWQETEGGHRLDLAFYGIPMTTPTRWWTRMAPDLSTLHVLLLLPQQVCAANSLQQDSPVWP